MASKHKLMYDGDESTGMDDLKWKDLEEGDLKCCFCNKAFQTLAALNAHDTWRELVDPPQCDHVVTCR